MKSQLLWLLEVGLMVAVVQLVLQTLVLWMETPWPLLKLLLQTIL